MGLRKYKNKFLVACLGVTLAMGSLTGLGFAKEDLSQDINLMEEPLAIETPMQDESLGGGEADTSDAISTSDLIDVGYRTHVEELGWQDWRDEGSISGTSGLSYRLEGIEMKLDNTNEDIGITYRTHVENIGWQDWKSDGEMSGTSAQALRLEAIQIKLTGASASDYNVFYQVHAQDHGWLDWAENGSSSGTEGYGLRLEAIRVIVTPKNAPSPGPNSKPFVKNEPNNDGVIDDENTSDDDVAIQNEFKLPSSGLVGEIYRNYSVGYYSNHYKGAAVDILNDAGTPVRASASGTVTLAGWYGGYGNCIIIDHGNGYSTLYAHFNSLYVSEGQEVAQDEEIGGMGSTGSSTANHVHFEIRVDDIAQRIQDYFTIKSGDRL